MKMIQLIKRILRQVFRDKRTMALLFVAPIFVITLLNYIFPDPDDEITIAAVDVDENIIEILEDNDVVVKEENDINPEAYLKEGKVSAVLEEKDEDLTITILNDNPVEEGPAMQDTSQAVMEHHLNQLSENIEEVINNVEEVSNNLSDIEDQLPPEIIENNDLNIDDELPETMDNEEMDVDDDPVNINYVYGDESYTFFEILNPILISFFVFFFVFLIAGISMLKERNSGTLEKLLSTPIRKAEIVFGYLRGYGIFAIIQTAIIILYSIYILDMEIIGSIINMFIINILLSFVALGLGLLLSTFVNSEFQMIQFIPLVIVPQIFFSGMLKVETMDAWLQWLAHIMPLYYAGNAMIDVALRGYTLENIITPLLILSLFIIFFVILNVLGMKRYRKV